MLIVNFLILFGQLQRNLSLTLEMQFFFLLPISTKNSFQVFDVNFSIFSLVANLSNKNTFPGAELLNVSTCYVVNLSSENLFPGARRQLPAQEGRHCVHPSDGCENF